MVQRLGEVIQLYLARRGILENPLPVCPRDVCPPPEHCQPLTGDVELDRQFREKHDPCRLAPRRQRV